MQRVAQHLIGWDGDLFLHANWALSHSTIGDPDDSVCRHKTLTHLVNLKVPHRNAELHRSSEVSGDQLND
jgi:hypothetical protein